MPGREMAGAARSETSSILRLTSQRLEVEAASCPESFRGWNRTAILAVGPAGILPADKCAKATGKMPIFPTAKMAVPRRLARFSTKLSRVYIQTARQSEATTALRLRQPPLQ